MPEAIYDDGQRENFGSAHASGGLGVVHISVDHTHIAKLLKEEDLTHSTQQQRHEYQARRHQLRQSLPLVMTRYNPVKQHPYWSQLLAWPDKLIVRFDGRPALGVRAPFSPLHDLERSIDWTGHGYTDLQPEERGWWIARVATALKLARAMHFLQQHTLVHTDLSPKNVFGDGYSGEMTLIDCDGIVSPGTPLLQTALGSPEYTAPELLMPEPLRQQRGIKREASFNTDDHALAVLLYQLLLYRHPLRGPKRHPHPQVGQEEEEARWLFAEGATYIEDPDDASNRPHGRIISAATLGPDIQSLFALAFVNGLRLGQPGKRPTAAQWEDALTRLYDRILPCSNSGCVQRFFAAPERIVSVIKCSLCGQELSGPSSIPYVRLLRFDQQSRQYLDDNYVVVGWPGRVLHEWHLATNVRPVPDDGQVYDPSPVARFEYDQEDDIWCLRNLRMDKLLLTDQSTYVPLGQIVRIEHGMKMWLSGEGTARLAVVEIGGMKHEEPIYALPEVVTMHNAPWPTVRAEPQDKEWSAGNPITLKRYIFQYRDGQEEEDPLSGEDVIQVIPPHVAGYVARVLVYALIAGVLTGIIALIVFGTALDVLAGAMAGLVIGLLLGIPITRAQWQRDYNQWRMDNPPPEAAS